MKFKPLMAVAVASIYPMLAPAAFADDAAQSQKSDGTSAAPQQTPQAPTDDTGVAAKNVVDGSSSGGGPIPQQTSDASGAPPAAASANPAQDVNRLDRGGVRQSLPVSKEVVSGNALQNAQDGYSDAVKNQAGVAPSSSKGSPSDTISIRGINLNTVSNYRINGGLAVASVMTIPTEDKEKLETLKGANALMFGVASPAGIINLVTKRATDADITNFSLSASSFGQYYSAIDIGRRFGEDKSAGVRINAAASHLENGVHYTGGTSAFASIGADWRMTDRLTVQGDFEYYKKDTILQATVSILSPVNGQVQVPNVPEPRNLLSGTWATYSGDTKNIQGRADYVITDNWKVMAELGRSDSGRDRDVTRVGKYNPVTGAGGVVTVAESDQRLVNTLMRTEVLGRFWTGWFKHDLTIGAAQSERETLTPFQASVTLSQAQNIFDPITLNPPPAPASPTGLAPQISKDLGLYAYDTVGVGRDFKALLGFRRTNSVQDFNGIHSSAIVNSPAGGFLWEVLPKTTIFGSYMKGLEDGAVAPVNAANPNEIQPPGVSSQTEIGLKSTFIKGLSFSGSYFYISRVNAVLDSVTNIFSNNGYIHFKGQEAVIAYDISRQWTINAAGQHLAAVQFSDDPKLDNFVPENTPHFLGNIFVTHRTPFVPGLTLTAGASYVTSRFVNPQDQGTIPGYLLISCSSGYETRLRGYRTSFQFLVDNIANKRYWNSAQQGTYGTGMDRSLKLIMKVAM